jgi:serine/threonine protein kinase
MVERARFTMKEWIKCLSTRGMAGGFEPPANTSPAAADIIAKFLVKDPTQRLGSLARGEREIFEQEWFNDMDLQALRR